MDRKPYQTDVTDAEWEILRAFMPPEKKRADLVEMNGGKF
jgi:transposase